MRNLFFTSVLILISICCSLAQFPPYDPRLPKQLVKPGLGPSTMVVITDYAIMSRNLFVFKGPQKRYPRILYVGVMANNDDWSAGILTIPPLEIAESSGTLSFHYIPLNGFTDDFVIETSSFYLEDFPNESDGVNDLDLAPDFGNPPPPGFM